MRMGGFFRFHRPTAKSYVQARSLTGLRYDSSNYTQAEGIAASTPSSKAGRRPSTAARRHSLTACLEHAAGAWAGTVPRRGRLPLRGRPAFIAGSSGHGRRSKPVASARATELRQRVVREVTVNRQARRRVHLHGLGAPSTPRGIVSQLWRRNGGSRSSRSRCLANGRPGRTPSRLLAWRFHQNHPHKPSRLPQCSIADHYFRRLAYRT
jgi:hypothetical protein